jgi:signal transduction histidine kinase
MLCELSQTATPEENRAVLVVEEEPERQEICRRLLGEVPDRGAGELQPLAARPGAELTELLWRLKQTGRQVAVAFVGLHTTASGNGLTTMQRIRELDSRILRVALTSRAELDVLLDPRHALARGAPDDWDHLCRPFSDRELRAKAWQLVTRWNQRRRHERQQAGLLWLVAGLADALEHAGPARGDGVAGRPESSLETLAARVAHEINSPLACVQSNLSSLTRYASKIATYAEHVAGGEHLFARLDDDEARCFFQRMRELREELKLDFVLGDLGELIDQSLSQVRRIQRVVQRLGGLSRASRDLPGRGVVA